MLDNSVWRLRAPVSTRELAEWDHDVMDLEQVVCPIDPGHRRGGKRLTDLSVTLPPAAVQDFVWTWYSECLIQDHVLDLFRREGFTGFDVKPVKARFKTGDAQPPRLWELVRSGWGGLARPESGITRVEYCETCKHVVYSGLKAPEPLIDDATWDGSDFFMVWPLPTHVFVSERVVVTLRKQRLTGFQLLPVAEMKATDGYSPGRLSYWMPEARARRLGEAAGIEEI